MALVLFKNRGISNLIWIAVTLHSDIFVSTLNYAQAFKGLSLQQSIRFPLKMLDLKLNFFENGFNANAYFIFCFFRLISK